MHAESVRLRFRRCFRSVRSGRFPRGEIRGRV